MEYLTRAFIAPVEAVGDGRTITGLLAPYGEETEVDDGFGPYVETFMPGCFSRIVDSGNARYLRVQLEHNGHWVGRGHVWRDTHRGLEAELRLDDTEAGREAAFKVRDEQTPGLSISFIPGKAVDGFTSDRRRLVKRERIKSIHHVALCPFPAYKGAQVAAIRSQRTAERLEYWKQWTERVRRV